MKKGLYLIIIFIVWTILVKTIDVQLVLETGTMVGFGHLNQWVHQLTGVNMTLYTITDWLGLVPVFICFIFGVLGLVQWIKRRNVFKVDMDILLLGCYYVVVIMGYLMFEMIPINYRPILIEGRLEVSYPSSTTLLVMSVMPTFIYQSRLRIKNMNIRNSICLLSNIFTLFIVLGRLISGVHWITDIIGSVMLSLGLFNLYKGMVEDGVWKKVTGVKKK